MHINFSETSFNPTDRVINDKDADFNFLTLGACSYIVSCGVEYGDKLPHILIGRFCSLAENISFCLGLNHEYKNVVTTYPFDIDFVIDRICTAAKITQSDYLPHEKRYANHHQIIIGNDVWIGRDAKITGGVKIGNGAIIGTNSMVTKDVPPYAIVAGNPARVVKYRFDADTIKKFMTINWWNWDINKIYKNIPLMYDTEKFLAEHYNPAETVQPPDDIESKLMSGWKVYHCVADFGAEHLLLHRIITGFCLSNFNNALLVIWLNEHTAEDIAKMNGVINLFGNEVRSHIITLDKSKDFSPQVIMQATHFITNREIVNLEYLDYLYDTGVKIISALDDKIFEGEPETIWNKFAIKS